MSGSGTRWPFKPPSETTSKSYSTFSSTVDINNSDHDQLEIDDSNAIQGSDLYKVERGCCDCVKITPKRFSTSSKFRKCPHRVEVFLVYIMFFLLGLTERGSFLILFFSLNAYQRLNPPETVAMYLFTQFLVYTMYPVMGYLADTFFGRYKVILGCLNVAWIGSAILAATFTTLDPYFDGEANSNTADLAYTWPLNRIIVLGVGYTIMGIGFTGITVNLIPFGVDQLPDSSSGELSSYFHWKYWFTTAGRLVGSVTLPFIYARAPISYVFLVMNFSTSIFIVLFVVFRHKLLILPKIGNPLGNVYNVLKFAWKLKKGPIARSAFQIGEPYPSRIDRAMVRNGGRFSVEQVEDVKTFFRILLILVSFFGYFVVYSQLQTATMLQGFRLQPLTGTYKTCPSFLQQKLTTDINKDIKCQEWTTLPPLGFASANLIPLLLLIPLFDRVIYPCLEGWKWLSMVGRMAIGKVFILLTISTALTVEIVRVNAFWGSMNNQNSSIVINAIPFHTVSSLTLKVVSPVNILVIMPQYLFFAFAELFCSVTAVEFIYAQSPSHMKGITLGLFFGMEGISTGITSFLIYILGKLPQGSFCSFFSNSEDFIATHVANKTVLLECLRKMDSPDLASSLNIPHQCMDSAICAFTIFAILSLLSTIGFAVAAVRYKFRRRELDPFLPIWLIPDSEPEKLSVCQFILRKLCCI